MLLFNRSAPPLASIALPFFHRCLRTFPKYYHPGINNHFGLTPVLTSKLYSSLVTKSPTLQQQQIHTAFTGFQNNVKHGFKKNSTFVNRQKPTLALYPKFNNMIVTGKVFPFNLRTKVINDGGVTKSEKRTFRILKGCRYFATALALSLIHYIAIKEKIY